MPIFFQQEIDARTRLAVWKIEEPENFFLPEVPLQRTITHPHKRLQHLAGRYLLKRLFPGFPLELIRIADTRKPFLEDEAFHFSISHCGDFAGVIVSTANRVGMDVELVTEKVGRIAHKFMSDQEQALMSACFENEKVRLPALDFQTLLWSCKEAVFKWYGLGGIDFSEHIIIRKVQPVAMNRFEVWADFRKDQERYLQLHSSFFGGLCLSFVVT